ncbi:hypothetical protein [Mycobacterium sp. ACS4331]|uniref:hypothetical protein n=1 Tax=Mycobacterium sp. ACS4331 TaxID=1834121 RepID=UPI0007FDE286|nr:hypothetical protein [Mycobacterium sp. ACS4331]OBF25550.1 hypothetical protein A5727_04245 [Mycobacterium sp. ACS4331]
MTRAALLAAALAAVAVSAAGPAGADPTPDAPCSADLDGALTRLTGVTWQCSAGQWRLDTDPYAAGDRWLSWAADPLVVHGPGRRNPEVRPGVWTGTPANADAQCSADLVDVVDAGQLGPVEEHAAAPGEVVTFTASATLFSATLSGPCLWQHTP